MANENYQSNFSLTPSAAHEYTTTTMSAPQLEGLTSRWLLKMLPWVRAKGGVYRVNRVATDNYQRLEIVEMDTDPNNPKDPQYPNYRISPNTFTAVLSLRNFHNNIVFDNLAAKLLPYKRVEPEQSIARSSEKAFFVIVSGTATGSDKKTYKQGDHLNDEVLLDPNHKLGIDLNAKTVCLVASITGSDFQNFLQDPKQPENRTLKAHLDTYTPPPAPPAPPSSPEPAPPQPPYGIISREYPLMVEQTVLSIPTRVADLYNDPMNQTQQQLKLVIEKIRERQEDRMINDPEFGLLNNIEPDQRIHTLIEKGQDHPFPTPHNLDRLITRHRNPSFLLAHPRAIAAIGRRISQVGVYPESIEFGGSRVSAWRGIPLLSCTKIPVTEDNYTSILVLRTGEENEGMIGLTETGLPDEYEPGLNVRFMGVAGPIKDTNGKEIAASSISYLVSAYFSAAALVPSALGVLDNVYVAEDID